MPNQVMVIVPHMDDEVLGCGGTIHRHVSCGDHVHVCVCANRAYGHEYVDKWIEREEEACRAAQKILGYQALTFLRLPDEKLDKCQIDIIIPVEETILSAKPDIVYIPNRGEIHQDHRAVFEAVRVACRPISSHRIQTIRSYEIPSGTDQTPGVQEWTFKPQFYVDVSEVIDIKIAAMACYERESRSYPHPRSPEGLRIYAQKRGMEAGIHFAEAFMILRDTWYLVDR